jgi:hypothetical protein
MRFFHMIAGVCCVRFRNLHMLQGRFVIASTDELGGFFVRLRSELQMLSRLHVVLLLCVRCGGVVLDVVLAVVIECHKCFQKMKKIGPHVMHNVWMDCSRALR